MCWMTRLPIPCCRPLPDGTYCAEPVDHDPAHDFDPKARHGKGRCGVTHDYHLLCRRAQQHAARKAAGAVVPLLLVLLTAGCKDDPCRHANVHRPCPTATTGETP
jgi:hypothetical protein